MSDYQNHRRRLIQRLKAHGLISSREAKQMAKPSKPTPRTVDRRKP